MSVSDDYGDVATRLALLELRQGIEAVSPPERAELYNAFGRPDDEWVTKARSAYAAMSEVQGTAASVGDELAAELDIVENAELYAALGGFDAVEITEGLGTWWSPSANWYVVGLRFRAATEDQIRDPIAFDRLLVQAGASALADFFGAVARGGHSMIERRVLSPAQRRDRIELAFLIAVIAERSRLFRAGPDVRGRFFQSPPPSEAELSEMLASLTGRGGARRTTVA